MLWSMIYNVKPNICICIFVSNGRLSFALEVRRRVLGFSKYHNKTKPNFTKTKPVYSVFEFADVEWKWN